MEELEEAHAVEDVGLEGCAHARPRGKRQVLLMDRETLEAFALAPGIARENITTEWIGDRGAVVDRRSGTAGERGVRSVRTD